jgi:hypothetical protein
VNKTRASAVAVFCVMLAGCGNTQPTPQDHGTQTKTQIGGSRVESFHSLASLRQRATAVVKVRVTKQSSDDGSSTSSPFTVSTVSVERAAPASAVPETILVRQLGTANTTSDDLPPVMQVGNEYILFVQPFHFTPTDSTGQYIPVGSIGVYIRDADGNFGRQDPGSPDLPAKASETSLFAG